MTLSIRKPDDMHLHLRDGAALARTVQDSARDFARAIIMPNLSTPITRVQQAMDYRERILAHVPENTSFTPLMTLYLTENMEEKELRLAAKNGSIIGAKLYPAGATTHSDAGVKSIDHIYPLLDVMAEAGLPLLVHGEATDPTVDIFDREKIFIEKTLRVVVDRFPKLKIVLEHITTKEAVDFIKETPANIGATITIHHLLLNRNDLFKKGICPHHYCLPILKRRTHQEALCQAATSGNRKFFLGTDSAPHAQSQKESACGCAGIYSSPVALPLYAQVFDEMGCIDKLENFASCFGAEFYGLPLNEEKIVLEEKPWSVPTSLPYQTETIIPFYAKKTIAKKITHP